MSLTPSSTWPISISHYARSLPPLLPPSLLLSLPVLYALLSTSPPVDFSPSFLLFLSPPSISLPIPFLPFFLLTLHSSPLTSLSAPFHVITPPPLVPFLASLYRLTFLPSFFPPVPFILYLFILPVTATSEENEQGVY